MVSIFHGELRFDNRVFHPTEVRVLALLDLELSSLGDPVANLAITQ
jgi:aminoglycoside phosphotransferase (APT) family kinase protein